jgi:hypothetical protein
MAVVTVEVGEGKGAVAAFQPASISHRLGKSGAVGYSIEERAGNAHGVTVNRVLVGPGPDLPQASDDAKFVQAHGGGNLDHRRIGVELDGHLDPVAGHLFRGLGLATPGSAQKGDVVVEGFGWDGVWHSFSTSGLGVSWPDFS